MAKKKIAIDNTLTLAGLSERYLRHMEDEGKSLGTCFSYGMELKAAQAELGAETLVSALTSEQIAAFNMCARVTRLKSGKPKAEPSILKTRRVLRLALAFAEQTGLIAASPVPANKDALAPEIAKPAKSRKVRKLAVPQAEAEAAADSVEAEIVA